MISFRLLGTLHPMSAIGPCSSPRLARLGTLALLAVCACGGDVGAEAGDEQDDAPPLGGFDSGDETTGADGSADGSANGSSGEEEHDDPLNCGESQLVVEATPSRLMLVLDKSGSMAINVWDHDGDPTTPEVTRWSSLHETVGLVTASFDGSIELGALLYPSVGATSTYDENACLVADAPEVPPGPAHAAAIMDALPGPDELELVQGGTPSATAVSVAVQGLLASEGTGRQAILFITDGEANCRADAEVGPELFEHYDDSLHTVVEDAWLMEGIPTYVVGIAIRDQLLPNAVDGTPDGINPHELLDLLAEQGGRPRVDGDARYYAANDQLELQTALSEIAAEQFDCTVILDPEPEHPAYVSIEVGGQSIDRVSDCATESGWRFTNPDGPYDRIELCGSACEQLAAEGLLDAFYGCPPPP